MTIKKYTGVYRDKKGRIFYQTEFKANELTGKRQRKKSYKDQFGHSFRTEKQAYEELCRIRAEFINKQNSFSGYMTFKEYLETVYLPYYKQTVQKVTYKTTSCQHKMFVDVFGKKILSDITVRDCEKFRIHLVNTYSPNYAKGVWIRFKQCLGYAERLGYIETFPCKALDNPKGKRPETRFWTLAEFQKVVQSFNLNDYEDIHRFTVVWLYFMTGVRVSEGLSLKWSDIDFNSKLLHVQSTLEYEGNGIYTRKDQTKTAAGIRYIELDDETISVLKRWREIQIQSSEDDFVLARFGSPLNKSTLSRILKRHAKKSGVPVITGKGLRHSHDSFMINVLKKDVLYVSQRSGRVDKATTLNTYSHLYDSQNATGGAEITQALRKFGVTSNPAKTLLK